MGRGSSGASQGGGGGGTPFQDFPEAFAPGKDFQAVGGVNHRTRTVSNMTQQEWLTFSSPMSVGITSMDESAIMRSMSRTPNAAGNYVNGYVRTGNAFEINKALYDPNNAGKPVSKIFNRKADRDTVRALDKAISSNTTQKDASYTRFSGANGIQACFGLTNQQMQILANAHNMTPSQLKQLNKALSGSTSHSKAFTSTSGNRTLNVFSAYKFERRISVPKGTHAFAPRRNAQESEVIFGRGLRTKLMGVSIGNDGHIVLHEVFDGYQ